MYTEALGIEQLNNKLNAILLHNIAMCNFKAGEIRESIKDCTKALTKDAQYYKAFVLRADCYCRFLMFDKAIQDFDAAIVSGDAAILSGDAMESIRNALKHAA